MNVTASSMVYGSGMVGIQRRISGSRQARATDSASSSWNGRCVTSPSCSGGGGGGEGGGSGLKGPRGRVAGRAGRVGTAPRAPGRGVEAGHAVLQPGHDVGQRRAARVMEVVGETAQRGARGGPPAGQVAHLRGDPDSDRVAETDLVHAQL